MLKNFVLDTNILLDTPSSIFGFADNNVFITGTTLQELDRKKRDEGDTGYNARECCRILDSLRTEGDLTRGVPIKSGGMLYIERAGVDQSLLPASFSISVPDNRIISSCISLQESIKAKRFAAPKGESDPMDGPVILVTNDISMRVNASILGVKVESYKNDHIEESGYTGHRDEYVPSEVISEIYKNDKVKIEAPEGIFPNEFVTLHNASNPDNTALSVYKRDGYCYRIRDNQQTFGSVRPLNAMQSYALYALMAPPEEIPLVILTGPAGTAKTFLSLAAGLSRTYVSQGRDGGMYRKILISRPNIQSTDPDFGYLPGDLEAKMQPLLASYYDNLSELLRGNEKGESDAQIQMQLDDMLADGIVEVTPLSYIRGRSIHRSYLICDEAQNARPNLIRDVITRAGHGTKIVVAGDPQQIDTAFLDSRNNGLIYALESMKDSPLSAVCAFSSKNSVRSPLAGDAILRMKPKH